MKQIFSDFETELQTSGKLIYTNVGVSMLPLIHEARDILVIEKCEVSSLKKYDVVLFRRENRKGRGEYILHRILKCRRDQTFFIAGDNCTDGETVKASQILGVLTGIRRAGGDVDFGSFRYRLYILFWCAPYHLRFFLLRVKQFLRYAVRAVAYKLKIKK